MTFVSVAMATFNGAAYLREQLDSFARQQRLPDELVVTDDGSTDATLQILDEFAASAPFPVRVHRNPRRLDYSRNFERAISLCTGDLIFLSDQDDVWFPEKIEVVVAELAERPDVEVVVNDQILTDAMLNHSGLTKLGNLRRLGKTTDGLIEGCCTAFRRRWGETLFPILQEAEPLLESRDLSHDRWLNELAILLNVRSVVRRPLQFFRRTGGNATSWIVSEPRRTGPWQLVEGRLPSPPTDAWERRMAVLDFYGDWLRTHRDEVPGHLEGALRAIAHERESVQQRTALAGMRRLPRVGAVWRLWRSGGYRYFERWMSAANDLTRGARS
jgi:glycosyltransferase involved in cell wall biosynthesis